jgi:hypothetical protein
MEMNRKFHGPSAVTLQPSTSVVSIGLLRFDVVYAICAILDRASMPYIKGNPKEPQGQLDCRVVNDGKKAILPASETSVFNQEQKSVRSE